MSRTSFWLSVLLSISLGANFWFLYRASTSNKIDSNEPTSTVDAQTNNNYEMVKHTKGARNIGKLELIESSKQQLINDSDTPLSHPEDSKISLNISETDKNNAQIFMQFLLNLKKNEAYEQLEFEVSEYLRKFPQDINAQLIEADVYYHTKPLNIALVHYQSMLSLPLSKDQRNQVETIISVNSQRIMRQFSGDGAWDLLASFLEPLVQVDPLNRNYLMALARAYGMQEQLSLMEDVLASFPPDDPRANRLRDSIFQRLNNENVAQTAVTPPIFENLTENESRKADVVLQQTQGRFVTQAIAANTSVLLLLDTGASTTALSDKKFADISSGYKEFLGKFSVNTAGGVIQAPIYKLRSFTLGNQQLSNISVIVLPQENLSSYDGLLGMNVISQFDLAYQASSQTMRMYKK
ncbi:retropepsin-like aspartic protease family protein [Glaciecola petra]|uniref:Retropepsin-like aspartic protease n=1 Tax=Glaciecola petra TaxID=3075602 RepID=A0ABU2ZNM6_9ALTE|nr:retropepsin-like aspartic protease [Aestuariibacter sp. P117]MDT0593949.1 retropepsin-like aspartic protease [Aestuariibacter sp. P117]